MPYILVLDTHGYNGRDAGMPVAVCQTRGEAQKAVRAYKKWSKKARLQTCIDGRYNDLPATKKEHPPIWWRVLSPTTIFVALGFMASEWQLDMYCVPTYLEPSNG